MPIDFVAGEPFGAPTAVGDAGGRSSATGALVLLEALDELDDGGDVVAAVTTAAAVVVVVGVVGAAFAPEEPHAVSSASKADATPMPRRSAERAAPLSMGNRTAAWTSAGQGKGSPVTFYERYGFERTGDLHGDEILLRLEIS